MTDTTLVAGNEVTQKQFMEGAQLMMRGWAMLFGSIADLMDGSPGTVPAAGVPAAEGAVPVRPPEKEAEQKKPAAQTRKTGASKAEAEPDKGRSEAVTDDSKPITLVDVQKAMGKKLMELTRAGKPSDAIGELFPKFGASCVSELKADQYVAFLDALSKL